MKDKEKALEIARLKRIDENTKYEHPFQLEVYERCLDMAEWKDEQLWKELFELSLSSNPHDYIAWVGNKVEELQEQLKNKKS